MSQRRGRACAFLVWLYPHFYLRAEMKYVRSLKIQGELTAYRFIDLIGELGPKYRCTDKAYAETKICKPTNSGVKSVGNAKEPWNIGLPLKLSEGINNKTHWQR
jgi:hypothetical protein